MQMARCGSAFSVRGTSTNVRAVRQIAPAPGCDSEARVQRGKMANRQMGLLEAAPPPARWGAPSRARGHPLLSRPGGIDGSDTLVAR